MGYDDDLEIKHTARGSTKTVGALQIRNSWGSGWGDGGYGWIPYDYVRESLARDWWTLTKSEWVETGKFGIGG
jgi:C1A family cysteine protease